MDIMAPRAEQVCVGKYYENYPKTPEIAGERFEYEYIDPTSWRFKNLFSNVTANESTTAAIKTKINLKWKVDGFVRLQDGRFYAIVAVAQDFNAAPKQAFRYFGNPAGVEFVIRLVEKDEPWGIK